MSNSVDNNSLIKIGALLVDQNRPLKERFRALFTLKNIGGAESIKLMQQAFKDPSALLKHEVAYCLGQMRDPEANKVLEELLKDLGQEAIVRHEAAEALGAIAEAGSRTLLEAYKDDKEPAVRETCQIALGRLDHIAEHKENIYGSVDPAPPLISDDVSYLEKVYLDENEDLFLRYRCMFRLRDLKTPESIIALCKGLVTSSSALFKHEVAFVLGQLQDPTTVNALEQVLCDTNEHEMVRHEAAEALGAIATKECYQLLKEYVNDEKRVVAESCEIALDMCEYENSPEFQYANCLQQLRDQS